MNYKVKINNQILCLPSSANNLLCLGHPCIYFDPYEEKYYLSVPFYNLPNTNNIAGGYEIRIVPSSEHVSCCYILNDVAVKVNIDDIPLKHSADYKYALIIKNEIRDEIPVLYFDGFVYDTVNPNRRWKLDAEVNQKFHVRQLVIIQ